MNFGGGSGGSFDLVWKVSADSSGTEPERKAGLSGVASIRRNLIFSMEAEYVSCWFPQGGKENLGERFIPGLRLVSAS